jgi:hypothetical protein
MENMKHFQLLLLIFLLLSVTTACQSALQEFEPQNDSLFKITFSYPAIWEWQEVIPYDELAQFEETPPSERFVSWNAPIFIQVYKPSNPQAQMQEWVDEYLRVVANMLRADTSIQIDGYNARWLTVVYPPLNASESHIQESVYLLMEDRFYIFGLSILESEVDGRFHKEFKELIKTIRILP